MPRFITVNRVPEGIFHYIPLDPHYITIRSRRYCVCPRPYPYIKYYIFICDPSISHCISHSYVSLRKNEPPRKNNGLRNIYRNTSAISIIISNILNTLW